MDIEINWFAVIVATVLSLVLARTWYAEFAFGKPWRELTGITPADSKKAGNTPMIITLFANIFTVIVLAALLSISSSFFGIESVWFALFVSFIAWLAFSATTLATHNAFEQKRQKLTTINNGYQLAFFLLVALVIGMFGF